MPEQTITPWRYTRLGRTVRGVAGVCFALACMALAVVLLVAVVVGAGHVMAWLVGTL